MGRPALRITADTHVLIRAALGDHPAQSPAAAEALREASLIAVTSPALCEFVWVLAHGYKLPAADIAAAIRRLLATANVTTDRSAVEAGLAFLDANGDFADGVIAQQGRALGGDIFLSFDERAITLARQLGAAAATPLPP